MKDRDESTITEGVKAALNVLRQAGADDGPRRGNRSRAYNSTKPLEVMADRIACDSSGETKTTVPHKTITTHLARSSIAVASPRRTNNIPSTSRRPSRACSVQSATEVTARFPTLTASRPQSGLAHLSHATKREARTHQKVKLSPLIP